MATTKTSSQRTVVSVAPGGSSPLSAEELRKMDAYWRASNYLSVGQIYLLDNPLLKEPLKREHIKPRLLGHWGTSPGLNMLCVGPLRPTTRGASPTSSWPAAATCRPWRRWPRWN